MKKLLFLLTIGSVLLTCEQRSFAEEYEAEITIPNSIQLFADSVSSAVVEVDFGLVLTKDQTVTFTTSKGLLLAPPFTPEETSSASNSLTLKPVDDQAEVLLVSHTLTPTNPVFVTVTLDGVSEVVETRFQEALPDDMQLRVDTPILSAGTEEVIIQADLYRETGYASNGIRFVPRADLEVIDSSQTDQLLWSLPDFLLSNNNQVTIPLRILQYAAGSELRVYLNPFDSSVPLAEKSILLRFE